MCGISLAAHSWERAKRLTDVDACTYFAKLASKLVDIDVLEPSELQTEPRRDAGNPTPADCDA